MAFLINCTGMNSECIEDNTVIENEGSDSNTSLNHAEVKEAVFEPTSQPSPSLMESKHTKKKLSLQERLAFAAQKKKLNNDNAQKGKRKEEVKTQLESVEDKYNGNIMRDFTEFNEFFSVEDKEKQTQFILKLKAYLEKKLGESDKIYKSSIQNLENELKDLKNKKANDATSKKESSLLKKISEKEEQVKALLEEGTKLSKKELLLNQSIKKLKAHETELEEENQSYEKIIEELNNKIVLLETKSCTSDQNERLLTEERLAYETLKKKYDSLLQANESLTDELKEIKFRNLDNQLEDISKELEEEREEHETLKDEYEKMELNFDKLKEETSYTLSELTKEVKKKERLIAEKNSEIKRLEDKVETLRFQNESVISSSMSNNNIDIIQQQYTEARENWNLIEKSYSQKINDLELQTDELQSANVAYSKKIRILTNDLKQKSSDINELQDAIDNLTIEMDALKIEKHTLLIEKKELEQNLAKLKLDFDNETGSLSKQIQQLEGDKINLETTLKLRNDELNMNVPQSPNVFYMQDLPSASSLNYPKPSPSIGRSLSFQRKYSLQIGDSATTPRQSATNSAFSINRLSSIAPMSSHDKILRHQNSIMSLDQSEYPLGINMTGLNSGSITNLSDNLTEIGEGNFTMESPNLSYGQSYIDEIPLGMDAEGEQLSTLNGGAPVMGGNNNVGSNIQLVKRLSAHVRILELEVSTLKDETLALAKEKESATNEIAKLIEENNKVKEIKDQVKEKEICLDEINNKYDEVLVLLGEKEERVGELSADVDDLKDLLRQQVQQMVDMQEKINQLSRSIE